MRVSKKFEDVSDAELLKRYVETADLEYFGQLYDRYLHLIYGLCMKYFNSSEDSKDATMEIFEHVSTAALSKEVTHFKSWLYVISKNHCLMQLRKKQRQEEKNHVPFMESAADVHLIYEEDQIDKDIEALTACIETLKEEQKRCVSLFYLKKKSYREVELITELSAKAVKSAIQNGKRNLKICVEARLKVLNE
ncbi:MAG: sigma-70 family RNA polymerase sigma factor [Cytophagales bacterium]|nr:sigma-70 family RNA polymerase sigma factor [Cytophagales bacterium]